MLTVNGKFMFHPLRLSSLTILSLMLWAGCSKPYTGSIDRPEYGIILPNNGNNCPIKQESYNQPGKVEQQWNIYYDNDGNLANVAGYNANGERTTKLLTMKMALALTVNGSSSSYRFDKDIFSDNPTKYTLTDANGQQSTRSITYDNSGNLAQILLTPDTAATSVASVTFTYVSGRFTQFIYKKEGPDSVLSIFNIDAYDEHPNPMHDMKASRFLFYNWEYFTTPFQELGRAFHHLSLYNWTHFNCIQNDKRIFDASMVYKYNNLGYPVSGAMDVITYSTTGAALTDTTYNVTYTYPCE